MFYVFLLLWLANANAIVYCRMSCSLYLSALSVHFALQSMTTRDDNSIVNR
jgi:hypothetical protein